MAGKIFRLRYKDGSELKCDGCGCLVDEIFVTAETPAEAVQVYEKEGGLCDCCFGAVGWELDRLLELYEDGGVVNL
jgi:hypothetical protein